MLRKRKASRRGVRAGLLTGAVVVAFGIGGLSASGASAAPSCAGVNITGEGASLQKNAQLNVWNPDFNKLCAGKGVSPTVSYNGPGSGPGLAAWDFNGPDGVPFDTSRAFTASDDAPTAAQIANAEAASGSPVVVIPVVQTAIGVVMNPPKECEVNEITNKQLDLVFRGTIKAWGKLDSAFGAGCAGQPITRVVRPVGSGTTYQFKNYLFSTNKAKVECTEGEKTWQALEPIGAPPAEKPNTEWPANGVEGCTATALSSIVTSKETAKGGDGGTGGGDLVKMVNVTNGSIGYASLPDIEGNKGAAAPNNNPEGDTHWATLQNNGLTSYANATFAEPAIEANKSANCSAAKYKVPANGRPGSGTGIAVDWSQSFGANNAIGGEAYPLCTITYDMSLTKYSANPGFTEGQEITAKDYLNYVVATKEGQADILAGKAFYAALPSNPTKPEKDVLGAAQLSASQIGF